MDAQVGFTGTLMLGMKLVNHKIVQRRLGTSEEVERSTNYGQVKGLKRHCLYDEDGSYYAFEGIPYAAPPLGELRFRSPKPPEPWEDVRDCTTFASKPMQTNFILPAVEGSEDCLYLNVYAKKIGSSRPLPVMVYLYGGGFEKGEATRDYYSPDYFMREDIVLVTFNYRVGAFGFLSFKDPDIGIPGNAGLKDQLLALRWVKENIQHFNGDTNNITLFGESAGAASAHLMMLCDRARGLFDKAILQSGSALCSWATTPRYDWGHRLAVAMGYTGSANEKETFRFLSSARGRDIVKAQKLLTKDEMFEDMLFISFAPVVEPYESEDSIILKPIVEMLKTAWGNEIPIIVGGNSFEGIFRYGFTKTRPWMIDQLDSGVTLIPPEARALNTAEENKSLGDKLLKTYFGQKKPQSTSEEDFQRYLQLTSCYDFWHGIHRLVLARRAYAPHPPTYLYRFDFDSPSFNHCRNIFSGRKQRGVSHADDISYLFFLLAAWKLDRSSQEFKTIERMIGMWTSFAANSSPNCPAIKPVIWEPVQTLAASDGEGEAEKCLNISEDLEFVELPETAELQVWDSLYPIKSLY